MFFSTNRFIKSISLAVVACGSLFSTSVMAQQKSADRSVLSIERNKIDNTPIVISFSPSAGWKKGQDLEVLKTYLGYDETNTRMQLVYATTTKTQITTSRYAQYFKGLKVAHGSFTLTEKAGLIHFISGNYYDVPANLSATPAISEGIAFGNALQHVGAEKYMWQDAAMEQRIKTMYHKSDTSYLPHGILTWIEDFSTGEGDRHLHLAYSFDIYAMQPLSRQEVFVDATTGKILYSNSLIKHTAATGRSKYSGAIPIQTSHVGATYWLYDSTRGSGVHTMNMNNGTNYGTATEITSAANTWPVLANDSIAIDAHWGGEMVYDYWRTQQGRLSWDNLDGILLQYVHYSTNYDNAYWDGVEMTYGDGSGCAGGGFTPLTSLDVTGHEIGHGVCQATANLTYASESGAINEGLSDCWGATIENWANPHEVDAVPKSVWKIGEEIGCGTPLRSMDFPHNESNPDTYGTNDPFWVNVVGCTPGGGNDQCGVHTNSGVTNKWYYLVVMGGTGTNANGNSYNVNAIGWTEAASILYATELTMPTNCTYANFRTLSIAAATTAYGACSPEVQCVTNAWYAVGVGTAFVPCTPQIGFVLTNLNTTENAPTTSCPASRTINIGLKPTGPAITGGNPVATVVVGHGTAVSGIDFTLGSTALTFIAGDTSTRYATLTIFDNGAVRDDKNLVLGFTLAPMGSTATISPTNDSMYINIFNNDSIPDLGGAEYHTLNLGTAATCNLTSAFPGANRRSRTQYILSAAEMAAAGVRAGVPITQIGFTLTTKSSTTPFVGYAISMANTSATDVSTAFVGTGLVNVVPAANHTTNLGLDTLNFTTSFTWDGTSNVMVQVCYGQNASNFGANDQMMGIQPSSASICAHNQSTSTGASGCSLGWSGSGSNLSNARPVMRFKQIAPPTDIATLLGSTRTWDVRAATQVYFYNPSDTNLIASLNNETANLGCVQATVTGAGVGFTPAAFSATTNRSLKEVTITPTINGATTTYDATIYLTNTELNSVVPSSLFLLKTDEPTDATISPSNSVLLTPTLITGTNYVGFKGTFTGFSRFFLVDGPLCTAPVAVATPGGPTTFCSGGSVVLDAGTATGVTYQWQVGSVNIPGATNSTYTANATGSYRILVTSGGCVGTSAVVPVTVNSVTAGTVNAATSSVCVGSTITLTDATTGGVWASGNNAIATVDVNGHVGGASAGTVLISYTVTNACGAATATRSITVNPLPVVAAITGTTTVCTGNYTSLSDGTSGGTWSSGSTGVATVNSAGSVGGASAGTANISYSVTNGFGCTTVQQTPVTVFTTTVATLTASGPTTFCTGSSVTLTTVTGSGLTYQWQDGGVDIAGATNSSYNSNTTAFISVIVTNGNGCISTSATVNTVLSLGLTVIPTVSISATPGLVICNTTTPVFFTATPVNGGAGPVYTWTVNGAAAGGGATLGYIPANGDVVKVSLLSNASCVAPDTASATVTMTISGSVHPMVSINPIPNDTICAGTMATFVGMPLNGGTTPTYLWKKNGINVATGPAYNYVPNDGDILVCTMTSNFPCRDADTAVSAALTVHIDTSSSVNSVTVTADHTSIIVGNPVTFTAVAPHGGTSPAYQWYINGVPVPGATSSIFTTTTLASGQIVTCMVTSSELCATPHNSMSTGVTILVVAGIDGTAKGLNDFTLMPNPNNGTFTIKGTLGSGADNINIKVTNMLGQVVYTTTAQPHNGNINETVTLTHNVAAGMYLVNITSAGGNAVFHVVINQ